MEPVRRFVRSLGRALRLERLSTEPNNTGQAIDGSASPSGQLGVRPDIRIGGRSIDGQSGSNTLAYAYFPDHGDIVFDTDNVSSFSNSNNNYRTLRNTLMHEAGHALGFSHVESNNAGILMEPFISSSYDGPQLDDILALQRNYGDALEKNGGNNNYSSATPLGIISTAQVTQIGRRGDSTSVSASQTRLRQHRRRFRRRLFQLYTRQPVGIDARTRAARRDLQCWVTRRYAKFVRCQVR